VRVFPDTNVLVAAVATRGTDRHGLGSADLDVAVQSSTKLCWVKNQSVSAVWLPTSGDLRDGWGGVIEVAQTRSPGWVSYDMGRTPRQRKLSVPAAQEVCVRLDQPGSNVVGDALCELPHLARFALGDSASSFIASDVPLLPESVQAVDDLPFGADRELERLDDPVVVLIPARGTRTPRVLRSPPEERRCRRC
jgi:hypothetical protein